jgi:sugar phosphate isomerase/epimerase
MMGKTAIAFLSAAEGMTYAYRAMTRRHFIRNTSLALGATALAQSPLPAHAKPLGMPIGFQTWVVREKLAKDFPGTLREMAAMGYQSLEMCSPPDYATSGFGTLTQLKAAEMRRIIKDAGLRCESCHYPFTPLRENLDARIAFAKELGLKQMVISSFWLKADATLADWMRECDAANKAGEKVRKAGLQLGFHNHHMEFKQLEGKLIYDAMLGELDPKLVKMQFQVAVISEGFEAAAYFKKYPGRFLSAHLADWSATEKKGVPLGQGAVDWKNFFAAAKAGGLKNYFVEMDFPTLQPSCDFLKNLSA